MSFCSHLGSFLVPFDLHLGSLGAPFWSFLLPGAQEAPLPDPGGGAGRRFDSFWPPFGLHFGLIFEPLASILPSCWNPLGPFPHNCSSFVLPFLATHLRHRAPLAPCKKHAPFQPYNVHASTCASPLAPYNVHAPLQPYNVEASTCASPLAP